MILALQTQHPPARVQVVAQEFSYSLSRTKVRAGRVIIELVNHGQDTHDLDMRRIGSTRIIRLPSVQPGQVVDRELKLVPGRYQLWCAIADHNARGMHAMLRVVSKKPARRRPGKTQQALKRAGRGWCTTSRPAAIVEAARNEPAQRFGHRGRAVRARVPPTPGIAQRS